LPFCFVFFVSKLGGRNIGKISMISKTKWKENGVTMSLTRLENPKSRIHKVEFFKTLTLWVKTLTLWVKILTLWVKIANFEAARLWKVLRSWILICIISLISLLRRWNNIFRTSCFENLVNKLRILYPFSLRAQTFREIYGETHYCQCPACPTWRQRRLLRL